MELYGIDCRFSGRVQVIFVAKKCKFSRISFRPLAAFNMHELTARSEGKRYQNKIGKNQSIVKSALNGENIRLSKD